MKFFESLSYTEKKVFKAMLMQKDFRGIEKFFNVLFNDSDQFCASGEIIPIDELVLGVFWWRE